MDLRDKPPGRSRYYIIFAAVFTACAIMLGSLWVTMRLSNEMVRVQSRLINASMDTKLNLTLFHLWLEEYLSGDMDTPEDKIWSYLDKAERDARAMLEGGEGNEGALTPVVD